MEKWQYFLTPAPREQNSFSISKPKGKRNKNHMKNGKTAKDIYWLLQ